MTEEKELWYEGDAGCFVLIGFLALLIAAILIVAMITGHPMREVLK